MSKYVIAVKSGKRFVKYVDADKAVATSEHRKLAQRFSSQSEATRFASLHVREPFVVTTLEE